MAKKLNLAEEMTAMLLRDSGYEYEREYPFHPKRKWRFDFIILPVKRKIALEIEGGIWTQGRHVRGNGFMKDAEKYNAASVLGWRVLRYAPQMISQFLIDDLNKMTRRVTNDKPKRSKLDA